MTHARGDTGDTGLFGMWTICAVYAVVQETGERHDLYGKTPRGTLVIERSGRMIALLMGSGRTAGDSIESEAALYRSMMSYSGTITLDEDTFTTTVEEAWDPGWEGTRQVRHYTLSDNGGSLSIRTAPIDHPRFPGQKIVAYLDWVRL